MRSTVLYEKIAEIMESFVLDDFNISQISNISGKVLSLPENFKDEVLSFFENKNSEKIAFNLNETFQLPINISNIEPKQKILFNTTQTELLFFALKEQAQKKGFVQSFFNHKLQSKIEKMIKKSSAGLVEMELVKEENSFFLNIAVYNEDTFDEDISLKEKNDIVEVSLDMIKEPLNNQFNYLVEYFNNICLMLENIGFNNIVIDNEIGYIDNEEDKVAGYVIKKEDKTDIILFNNLFQQFEYETNVLNRNRVLEKVAEIEVNENRNDVASKYIETGFFTQQEYSKMYNQLLNNNADNTDDDFFNN